MPTVVDIPACSDLSGKAVLVTGGSRGIGAATALAFARHGADVVVHYASARSRAEELLRRLEAIGCRAHLVQGDFTSSAAVRRVVEEAAHAMGGLDIVINNAGTMIARTPLEELRETQIDAIIELNARAVVAACRAALPHLRKRGGGSIINTTSISARAGGSPGSALYSASKAFVSTLTRALAREFAPHQIRVNAVSPGTIATDFHERYSSPEKLAATAESIPLKRLGNASDLAGAYLFLASPSMSGYITGQIIEVNGGQLMG